MPFSDLHLSDALLRAVADSGYDEPTAIQAAAIPQVLMGRDLIGVAQTGTGKTASFVLPMIDILAEGRSRARMPRSLILEPTRELAAQVAENFEKYGKYHKLSMALLIGGVAFGDQDKALEKGVDVLIATPGRLMDQHSRGKILLSGVDVLVIDEADRMLDMGFIPDVEKICALLKPQRQTLLFSATMPGPIRKLADAFMTDPRTVQVARAASTNADIAQSVMLVGSERAKRGVLEDLLRDPGLKNAIVFCNRKTTVRDLATGLKRSRFRASQIHGDMEQSDRLKELDRFKAGEIDILVASDVAARGLDIKGVSHVFNMDVPWHPDDYVHRIGRTGRAGATGIAITLAAPSDMEAVERIEKLIGQAIPRRDGGAGGSATPAETAPAERPSRRRPAASRDDDAPDTAEPPSRPPRERSRPAARRAEPPAETGAEPEPRAEPAPRRERAPRPPRDSDTRRAPREDDGRRTGRANEGRRAERENQGRRGERENEGRRGERENEGRRGERGDDLGPRFAGFGEEGVPAFLQVPARR
ncbi:DEAD/DEAH box helicase [Sandaracinobacteroides saxicola]|uniref:DEAD-box ATP-dependent RNA helicase RhpA n=1 Tax=Sandaracinobacteroides saxicola TaxID=2759707 RepID=A0A7G5IGU8_9SPHN|nr:DEAD/DEAH box helicase [Sandaracinobacteroides saxicola]QMW22590.1 DEAD/DEAH box helicase [Sandaracinobacteroides saxicola]